MNSLLKAIALGAAAAVVQAQSINEINGKNFLSPYNNKAVSNVTGIVVAKSASGLFLRSPKISCDTRIGNGLYVYSSTLGKNTTIAVGDSLTLSGTVVDYRSNSAYLYSTELTVPVIQSWTSGNGVVPKPRVIGRDTRKPPTVQFTSLDNGDIFSVPNNVSQISVVNPKLQPDRYGLDFWKSLDGDLVTIPHPVAIGKPNQYAETWMVGSWPTTGKNGRGGLTLSHADANPEAIKVDSPIDGSKGDDTYVIGDTFENITGVVHYQFGFYYLIPLAAPVKIASPTPKLPPPSTIISTGSCSGITIGDYNVENMQPTDTAHIGDVAAHIVDYLKTPDLVFVQEIQDNSGATDNGIVDSSTTLANLAAAIAARTGGVQYSYTWINPSNGKDGGQPGGNIRQAYLYNPKVVSLHNTGAKAGGSADVNAVLTNSAGKPTLKFNPGRIDPANDVWDSSRKPLAAEWKTVDGHVFFTVNVHWSSKGGSSSLQGDLRPPVNKPVEERTQQANVTASFIAEIIGLDSDARVIMAGDLNEYAVVQPVKTFASVSGLIDINDAANIPLEERYTYTYDMDMEELDHMFVSPAIAAESLEAEHLHINTWVSYDDQVSDHDPTVAKLNLCGANIASNATVSGGFGYSTATSSAVSSATTLSTVTTKAATTTAANATTIAATTATAPTAIATAGALSGKGKFSVVSSGVTSGGGLISAGTWYRGGGTLASYTAVANADGETFTLSTSKGACAISATDAALSCASTVTSPSSFGFDGTYLTYGGSNVFYASALPTGSTQGTVYASAQAVSLQITWVYV
ncbi:endonuclease exonuclease phosphatase family protein [Ophiostoma piceae UAMH 11346]|uniref:Endonuclease exonuclease phosphatase family protein n=1 Tax=Ophiostoma piceae (strain UAMH 11346) TaxID=1262450 RepID=S3D0K5_OPHP1|nr:endonuclease exonuclease phosphatase family protein [Ophiostoma piceae UAMH 11346]